MKKLFVVSMISLMSLSAFTRVKSVEDHSNFTKSSIELSDEQMTLIEGSGCTWYEWLAAFGGMMGCGVAFGGPVPPAIAACLSALGIFGCFDSSDPGTTGPPCEACPSGGYEEEGGLCQQLGGQIMGASNCGRNTVCCQTN